MLRAFALLAALAATCAASGLRLNVGGSLIAPDWRCDTGKFVTSPASLTHTSAYLPKLPPSLNAIPTAVFRTLRYSTEGNLVFTVPVPPGAYKLSLLFVEVWRADREFTVSINKDSVLPPSGNATLNVHGEAGGFDIPFLLDAGLHQSVNDSLTITLGRVPGKRNPVLSGFIIDGPAADTLIASEGLESCPVPDSPSPAPSSSPTPSAPTPSSSPPATASPLPSKAVPSPPPTVAPICGKAVETEFASKHFAHAVTGGPYIETDFKKLGYAAVNLDGTNSHSHFQTDKDNGKIRDYEWIWTDPSNPEADTNGLVTVKTSKTTQNFPLGVTTVTLLVKDQFCNSASESSTVTVNSATLPGAYCYYYNFGLQTLLTVPLPVSKTLGPRPEFGTSVGDINFATTKSFGDFPFHNSSFAVRCSFFINVAAEAEIEYKLIHSGPVKAYHEGALLASSDSMATKEATPTDKKVFSKGLHEWQILYLRPSGTEGKLAFQFASGAVIPEETVRHDSGRTMPIITGSNKNTGSVDELILIFGTSFVNNVVVKFDEVEAETIETSTGVIQARVPRGAGDVNVTVTTEAGVSNSMFFVYKAAESFPIKFTETTLTTPAGAVYSIDKAAVVKYGPDGRLYCGATNSKLFALSLNKAFQVTQTCENSVYDGRPRAVLGLAFDPASPALRLHFATSTLYWGVKGIIDDDAAGWTNGKVQAVTMAGPTGCFNDDITDVVTGLPVSNHDHGVSALQFLPDGRLLISVGGFTNGGIAGAKLGGLASNPLAGALVACPASGGNITYTSDDPLRAQLAPGGACRPYATGFRNAFGLALHSNGALYATDNGPNKGFGKFATDCAGGTAPSRNLPDKLFRVEPGRCHGHPSLNRGRAGAPAECAVGDLRCVAPLLGFLQSSTNGVVEYRSNVFADKMKGNLFLSKYTGSGEGRVSRVILDEGGGVARNGFTNVFWPKSGLSLVEGPRGELVMSRVFKESIMVLLPDYPAPTGPFFISVMPREGPAHGGNTVLVTGHNFGDAPAATFGGKPCTDVKPVDDGAFTCVVPPAAANTQITVAVTAGNASAPVTTGSDYWYM